MRHALFVLALVGFVAACSPSARHATQESPPPAQTLSSATTVAATAGSDYTNAFAYCRAVGTIDKPDARYSGPNPPPTVIAGLIKAFGAPPAATRTRAFTRGTYWRCMDGAVYACNVGANLPCESKANTSRAPTSGERKYCAANHDSLYIPMYVTGHNTIYDWRCKGAEPVAGKTLSKVDARGYLANIWYEITPPGD